MLWKVQRLEPNKYTIQEKYRNKILYICINGFEFKSDWNGMSEMFIQDHLSFTGGVVAQLAYSRLLHTQTDL